MEANLYPTKAKALGPMKRAWNGPNRGIMGWSQCMMFRVSLERVLYVCTYGPLLIGTLIEWSQCSFTNKSRLHGIKTRDSLI